MDEVTNKIPSKIRLTSASTGDVTPLSPAEVTDSNVTASNQLTLDHSKLRRTTLLHQGCYFSSGLCIIALFASSQIFANLVPMIWLALWVELIGISSVIGPTSTVKTPVKSAARTMILILAAPVLFLIVCSCLAHYLPKQVLEFAVAPISISGGVTFYLLGPLFKNIESVLVERNRLTGFQKYLVNNGLHLGAQISIILFPAWLLISHHKNWEQLIPFFAIFGFVAFAVATKTLINPKAVLLDNKSLTENN